MSELPAPLPAAGKRMDWLLRYVKRCQVKLDASELTAHAIKGRFTPAAWRLLCRSGRECFIPILHNRRLAFDSLVRYTQSLIEHGFQLAPHPEFLGYFIQASYLFFDRMPGVPDEADELVLLRLATRCGGVSRGELRCVHQWLVWSKASVTTRMQWRAVLRRAGEWHQRQQLAVEHARSRCSSAEALRGWDFTCGSVAWEGYDILPLSSDIELWDEGQAMSNCLYKLRYLCRRTTEPSRFFSVRRKGLRYATLELVRRKSCDGRNGLGRVDSAWQLQDCRLSHNRLPSDALVRLMDDFGIHYDRLSRQSADTAAASRMRSSRLTSSTQEEGPLLAQQNGFCHAEVQA